MQGHVTNAVPGNKDLGPGSRQFLEFVIERTLLALAEVEEFRLVFQEHGSLGLGRVGVERAREYCHFGLFRPFHST